MERAASLRARAAQAAQTSQSAPIAQWRQTHARGAARAQRRAPRGCPPRALTTRSRALARDDAEGTTASNDAIMDRCEELTAQALASKLEELQVERLAAAKRLQSIEVALTQARVAVRKQNGGQVLANYGYTKEQAGLYYDLQQTGVPSSLPLTAAENFLRESRAIVETVFGGLRSKEKGDASQDELRDKLAQLKLSNQAVWDREHAREAAGGGVWAPWFLRGPYLALCVLLDVLFDGRPVQRFWFLETVARTPYFSYNTMLYIYEVLGWWRRSSELRKVHFAEEWNEYHHLLVMESLGGDSAWIDRFLGQHSAVVYYFALVILWLLSPAAAYNFSELIEAHAVDTYGEFVDANEELLKTLPPPAVAISYWEGPDLYMFDEFQTALQAKTRRPKVDNLYDVFCNIRDDEAQHVATMEACQDPTALTKSPNAVAAATALAAGLGLTNYTLSKYASEMTEMSEVSGVDGVVSTLVDLDLEFIIDAITALLSL